MKNKQAVIRSRYPGTATGTAGTQSKDSLFPVLFPLFLVTVGTDRKAIDKGLQGVSRRCSRVPVFLHTLPLQYFSRVLPSALALRAAKLAKNGPESIFFQSGQADMPEKHSTSKGYAILNSSIISRIFIAEYPFSHQTLKYLQILPERASRFADPFMKTADRQDSIPPALDVELRCRPEEEKKGRGDLIP
jgi:hypothetical protein